MIPLEVFTLIGGSAMGFLFKFMAERAKDRQQQFEMMIKTLQAKDDSADRAASRDKTDGGRWIRRLIVMAVLFGVILAPFILAIIGKPVIVEIETPTREWLFGIIKTGGVTKFYELGSYLLIPELRASLMAIIGFYFGNASATTRK